MKDKYMIMMENLNGQINQAQMILDNGGTISEDRWEKMIYTLSELHNSIDPEGPLKFI